MNRAGSPLQLAARAGLVLYLLALATQDGMALLAAYALGFHGAGFGWVLLWAVRAAAELGVAAALLRQRPGRAAWAALVLLGLSALLHILAATRNPFGFHTGRLMFHAVAVVAAGVVGRARD